MPTPNKIERRWVNLVTRQLGEHFTHIIGAEFRYQETLPIYRGNQLRVTGSRAYETLCGTRMVAYGQTGTIPCQVKDLRWEPNVAPVCGACIAALHERLYTSGREPDHAD